MNSLIVCVELDIPEFVTAISRNVRSGFATQFVDRGTLARDGLGNADYVLVAEAPLTATTISTGKRLKLIQSVQVGCDNIEISAARRVGIPVANVPGVNSDSVAEHTLMLMLAVLRRLSECDAKVHNGEWPQLEIFRAGVHDLTGKTVGIIGFGNIGMRVAQYVGPIAGNVLYYSRTRKPPEIERRLGVEYTSLADLLHRSDVVTIHVPLTTDTRGLISQRELSIMQRPAILINTSRAAVIDEGAFLAAMREGRLRGAGLDVLWHEPPGQGSAITQFPNVILTPHVGAASIDVVESSFRRAFENVYRVASGEFPRDRVDVGA